MTNFSYYLAGITNIIPTETITIECLRDRISSILLKDRIEQIQKISLKDKKQEKLERNKLKAQLPYCTPAGVFSKRNKKDIISQSGYAPIDIDDINNIEKIKEILSKDKYIKLIYTSPSGSGLKIFIEIPINPDEYSTRVQTFYEYLAKTYNINIDSLDSSTCDISRACYLSYDSNIYYNENNIIYNKINNTVKAKLNKVKDKSESGVEFTKIISLLYRNKSKEYIYEYMSNNFNKWNIQGEAYQDLTYNKALMYCENNPPAKQFLQELISDLAKEIKEKLYVYAIRNKNQPDIYIYKDGIYVNNGNTYIYTYIKDTIGKYYTKRLADRILDLIIPDCYIDVDDFFKEEEPHLMPVQNGILNLFTKELQPFTPDKKFFSKLDVEYDINATCETTKEHYNKILYPKDILIIQELFGYLLYKKYTFQKAFMFSGNGSNGKSYTITQMRYFLNGKNKNTANNNCVNLSLQTLESKQFMKGNLHQSLANLADDIGNTPLKETQTFKELTGGGMITADVKHSASVSFVNYAKMIFNANTIPKVEDEDSDGFWRRWIVIRFESKFYDKTEYDERLANNNLPKRRCFIKDNSIEDKLKTPEELSGVLNWALEGFERLWKQQSFTYSKNESEIKKIMKRYSSSVVAFIQDCLEETNNENYEEIDFLYNKYCEYYNKHETKQKFVSRLQFRKELMAEYSVEEKRGAVGRIYNLKNYKFIGIPEEQDK